MKAGLTTLALRPSDQRSRDVVSLGLSQLLRNGLHHATAWQHDLLQFLCQCGQLAGLSCVTLCVPSAIAHLCTRKVWLAMNWHWRVWGYGHATLSHAGNVRCSIGHPLCICCWRCDFVSLRRWVSECMYVSCNKQQKLCTDLTSSTKTTKEPHKKIK